jgi:PadR family transcriptional regulator, regulatory protein PadR
MGMDEVNKKYKSDLLRGSTDTLLLYIINEMGKTYAYRIIKELRARSAGYFRFSAGTTYPALQRLEDGGLIQGERKKLPNGSERHYYSITGTGQELLRRKLAMWRNFASAIALVVMRLKD